MRTDATVSVAHHGVPTVGSVVGGIITVTIACLPPGSFSKKERKRANGNPVGWWDMHPVASHVIFQKNSVGFHSTGYGEWNY